MKTSTEQLNLFEADSFQKNTPLNVNKKNVLHDTVICGEFSVNREIGEFWTSKQRQASNIHEVSYRACFKPQLPKYFIEKYTKPNDLVYDPFGGRGTTVIEAALLGRNIIQNDINPLSTILAAGRLSVPSINEIERRLEQIAYDDSLVSDIDLTMFYENKTLIEILSLRKYFIEKEKNQSLDHVDLWIRMVATNRLTGHSKGFFSVYTLPPNQATTQEKQRKINIKRNQVPTYKDTKKLILKKSTQLLKDISNDVRDSLQSIYQNSTFLNADAGDTKEIKSNSVNLVVTSPPFLNIVKYKDDNWLRCWFNNIDHDIVGEKITMSSKLDVWSDNMSQVLIELKRVLKPNGVIAFEVGEVRNGKIKLDEVIAPLGIKIGLTCEKIMINSQEFTKTSNIWGVKNNDIGTNSNRIVIFRK